MVKNAESALDEDETMQPKAEDDPRNAEIFLVESKWFSKQEVRELEDQLAVDQDNLEIHAKLASFHMWQTLKQSNRVIASISKSLPLVKEPDSTRQFRKHILWIIENHPSSPFLANPFIESLAIFDEKGTQQAVEAWQSQIAKFPNDANIAFNASCFLWFIDVPKSVELKKRAVEIAPDNPRFSKALALFYSVTASKASSPESKKKAWQLSLHYKKMEYECCLAPDKRRILQELANIATNAGDTEAEQKYSAELERMQTE